MARKPIKYTLDSFHISKEVVENHLLFTRNGRLVKRFWKNLTAAIKNQTKLQNIMRDVEDWYPVTRTNIVIKIIYLVYMKGEVTSEDVAKYLQCSKRTAQRHLHTMCCSFATKVMQDLPITMNSRLTLPSVSTIVWEDEDFPY